MTARCVFVPALRAISLADVPTSAQLSEVLQQIRERRTDIADMCEFRSLTGMGRGETRAARVGWVHLEDIPQIIVFRSHSDRYEEKDPKSWRGTRRAVPLSPRAHALYEKYAAGKHSDEYLFTNQFGTQLSAGLVRKFPLGFRPHALRHYPASTWLRLGTPVHEVAEYLGDDPRTVLAVYAHVLGEDQRREHLRLARAEETGGPLGDPSQQPGPRLG